MKILTVAFMLLFNYLDPLPKLYQFLPIDASSNGMAGWVLRPATQRTMLTREDIQPTHKCKVLMTNESANESDHSSYWKRMFAMMGTLL